MITFVLRTPDDDPTIEYVATFALTAEDLITIDTDVLLQAYMRPLLIAYKQHIVENTLERLNG